MSDENGQYKKLHNEKLHSLYCSPDRLNLEDGADQEM